MILNKYLPFYLLLALITLTLPVNIFAQCENDQILPVPVCHAGIYVEGSEDTGIIIWAQDLDAASYDNCTEQENLLFRLELGEGSPNTPPETSSVELPLAPGVYFLSMWVGDEAGNWDYCFSQITVLDPSCPDDEEAPQAICTNIEVNLNAPSNPEIRILAASLGLNSTDNCDSGLDFTGSPAGESTSPAGENNLFFTAAGSYLLDIWVVDDNGNFSSCVSTVTVHEYVAPDCDNDVTPPTPICINGMIIDIDDTFVSAGLIDGGSFDDCTDQDNLSYRIELIEGSTGEIPTTTAIQLPNVAGDYPIIVWVGDEAGNWDFCTTYIVVDGICEDDIVSPVAVCLAGLQASAHPIDGVTIWPQDIDVASYDNCSDVTLELNINEGYEGVVVNELSITFPPVIGEYFVTLNVFDENENVGTCWSTIHISGISTVFQGQIFIDDNENCDLDANEEDSGFQGWVIRATDLNTGITTDVFTDVDGHYELRFISELADNIQLEVILPNGQSSACNTSTIHTNASGEIIIQNFAVEGVDDCSYLTVDVGTSLLRRCFENIYFINYSNYSTFDVADATINLTLDLDLSLVEADLPYTELADGSFLFELGDIPATSGGFFYFTATLSCDAALGATHCVRAKILPFDCFTGAYAELKVEGECDEVLNQVLFKITNIGTQATTEAFSAIIVEDVVMNMHGSPIDLAAGESMEFDFPANGATWRYEVAQDPSFPYGGIAVSFVEGCGGFTPNITTQFSLINLNPNISFSCQENVGSWDPNDKQAFPRGRGDEHIIEANTPIEYLIRFQNTGTDTAFTVVVEDQLSAWLDPASLRPGASSHPYRLEQKENGLLIFHFDNIMLPDSNINQAASNGFIKFYVDQVLDAPLGTTIDNTANIYFDFNDAVVTNTVRHTIGENAVIVGTQQAIAKGIYVEVYPNPIQNKGMLVLNNYNCQKGALQVFDLTGRLMKETPFNGHQVSLNRKDFGSSGLYFFQILDEGQLITQGKLIIN